MSNLAFQSTVRYNNSNVSNTIQENDFNKNTTILEYKIAYGNKNLIRKPDTYVVTHYCALCSRGDVFMNLSVNKIKSIQRLNEIEKLPENWNENNAHSFSKKLIEKCKNIIYMLSDQPEIFPTASDSIQMEYEKDNGEYLEFNILEECINVFRIYGDEREEEYVIDSQEEKTIREVVNDFYARN